MELGGLKKKVLGLILRESVHSSFGKFLLSPLKQVDKINKGLAFHYKVPPSLCRIQKSKPVISNAAVLALFDELSTDALIVTDKNYRGGVSVHLTTELIKPAALNEDVVIHTTADKIGKELGFCSMEMRSPEGTLLAKGKHIKFLPMGWLWDLVSHPVILPIALYFYQIFRGSKFKTDVDEILYKPRVVEDNHDEKEVASVFSALSIEPSAGDNSEKESYYKVRVKSFMKNRLGALHGGAAASVIEEACEVYLNTYRSAEQQDVEKKLYVEKMEVRYFSPLRGEIEVQVRPEESPFHSNEVILVGAIVSTKHDAVCVEFKCSCTRG